jgi:glycosyltransferase involved in cell wall biosynthesis
MTTTSRLQLGVDFHVVDGKFQGSRTMLLELYSRAVAMEPETDFHFYMNTKQHALTHSKAFSLPNAIFHKMPTSNPAKRLVCQLSKMAYRDKLDVLHMQYISPLFISCPTVITLHDVLFEDFPQYFTAFFRLRSHLLFKRSARKAAHIFAASDYSKEAIMRHYHISDDKLSVCYSGVDNQRFKLAAQQDQSFAHTITAGNPYFLTVGRLEPRKNHKTLLHAFRKLQDPTVHLLVVGQKDFNYADIYSLLDNPHLKERVHFLENITDDVLPNLYQHAYGLVYPSFAEGFGIPIVEAMACGCPVITGNKTSLPEVAGGAAIEVNPEDPDMLASAMDSLLTDPALRHSLISRGVQRVAEFSWDRSALIMMQQIHRVANSR